MIGCPTCKPSDIACVYHCPMEILNMMHHVKRNKILRLRKARKRGKTK